jgi:hypothetical protein
VLYTQIFKSAVGEETALSGEKARDILVRSGLDANTLSYIRLVSNLLIYNIQANIVGRLLIPQNPGNSTFQSSH